MGMEIFEKPTDTIRVTLKESTEYITVAVVDEHGFTVHGGNLLIINKNTGRVVFYSCVSEKLGCTPPLIIYKG